MLTLPSESKDWLITTHNLPHLDWDKYDQWAASQHDESPWRDIQLELIQNWLIRFGDALDDNYQVISFDGFLILCPEDERIARIIVRTAEESVKHITSFLGDVAFKHTWPANIIVALNDRQAYVNYLDHLDRSENQTGAIPIGGEACFISRGFPHTLINCFEIAHVETQVRHELFHASVYRYPIPLWLDEAIACYAQNKGHCTTHFDEASDTIERLRTMWNQDTIQQFWSGDGWSHPDVLNRMSYALSEIIMRDMLNRYSHQDISEFVSLANHHDAGEAAARKVFNLGIADLAASVLGPGDWTPKPATWYLDDHDSSSNL